MLKSCHCRFTQKVDACHVKLSFGKFPCKDIEKINKLTQLSFSLALAFPFLVFPLGPIVKGLLCPRHCGVR